MYSSIKFHIIPLMHYLFAFLLLFTILSSFLFSTKKEDIVERWFSRYVKMILLIICSGYILVLTKLYEVISLLSIFLVIIGYKMILLEKVRTTGTLIDNFLKKIFDLLDGIILNLNWNIFKKKAVIKYYALSVKFKKIVSLSKFLEGFSLSIIIGVSIYLRFYDSFVHAAPPMADSYVTLAWMKYIDSRYLFHDGIYPQGFHIYLATLFKFAAVDALFILRYTGPLNTVLITIGLYLVIRKLTNNGIGALTASGLFGVVWVIFPFFPIERQAATNSQEFAFVFIFPTVYFLIKYFTSLEKEDLIVSLSCIAIIGLVHSLAFAFIGLLIGLMILSVVLTLKNKWKQILLVCLGAIGTVFVSLIPLGIGKLLGKGLHSASAEYLVENDGIAFLYPTLSSFDYITLGLLVILFFFQFQKNITSKERFVSVFIFLAGLTIFTLYYAGGVLTHSVVIASRSNELWALMMPLCIGICISYLLNMAHQKWNVYLNFILVIIIFIFLMIYKPEPIVPYKLEHDENIEQYMRIRNNFLPKTWMIVSQEEGYSISYGTGFHMYLSEFLNKYNPKAKALTKLSDGSIDKNIPLDIFIYQEKNMFQVSKDNSVYLLLKQQYVRRAKEYTQLAEWIKIHRDSGFKVETFFENENIVIYHLQTSHAKSHLSEKIWND